MRKYFYKRIVIIVMCLLFQVNIVESAQEKRRIEEDRRKSLQEMEFKIIKGEKRFLFDYGGWMNFMYNDYNDSDNNSDEADLLNDTYSADLRLWFKATFKSSIGAPDDYEHTFYLRLKDLYSDEFPEDVAGGYDHDGPHLDHAYVILDFSPVWIEAGRRYFKTGRGIAYSNVNDGIQINYLRPRLNLGAFVSHTLPHEDNIDTSVPGYSKDSDRFFYGLGAGYTGIRNHQLYAYFLLQRDYSNESPESPDRQYTYNSDYIGIGALGKVTSNIKYWMELIKEGGKSYVFNTNEKKDIDAWAGDIGVTYDWDVYSRPRFFLEYAFGSGDADRISVTDAEGGNTAGDDENFLYFGYFSSGLALSPRLSNIHLYRIGVECNPLEKISFLRKFMFRFDYFRYYKDKADGGIYDLEATENSKDIGSEIDFCASWDIFSDLDLSVKYGLFIPGEAFAEAANNRENYFSLSMTVTF